MEPSPLGFVGCGDGAGVQPADPTPRQRGSAQRTSEFSGSHCFRSRSLTRMHRIEFPEYPDHDDPQRLRRGTRIDGTGLRELVARATRELWLEEEDVADFDQAGGRCFCCTTTTGGKWPMPSPCATSPASRRNPAQEA